MQTTRIFIDCPLQVGATIKLDTHAAGHVARVLRLRSDNEITLFNGLGGEYPATLQQVSKREVTALINSHIERSTESPLHITLAQGILRGERMDYTLQKATELGINRIVPLLTQRCNVQFKGDRLEKRLQHWRGVLIAACEQSGRNRLPELLPAMTLSQWLETSTLDASTEDASNKSLNIVLHHRASQGIKQLTPPDPGTGQAVSLLIGPEGGLDEQEINLARKRGYQEIQLGPRVLHTETAALAALAAIQTLWGDLS